MKGLEHQPAIVVWYIVASSILKPSGTCLGEEDLAHQAVLCVNSDDAHIW